MTEMQTDIHNPIIATFPNCQSMDKIKTHNFDNIIKFKDEDEILEWVKEVLPFATLFGINPKKTNVGIRIAGNEVYMILYEYGNDIDINKKNYRYNSHKIGTVDNHEQITKIERITELKRGYDKNQN